MENLFEYLAKDAKAVYQYGSVILDYIVHKNDDDKCYFYETTELYDEKMKYLRLHRKELREQKIDVHLKDLSTFNPFQIWAYQHRYARLLSGEHLDFENINILEHKQEYLDYVKEFVNKRIDNPKLKNLKIWYHIYTGLSIIENDSYELTDQQIKDINRLHDCYYLDDRSELVDWCLEKLGIIYPEFTE